VSYEHHSAPAMRIALFNYVIAPHSGPGSRDLEVLQDLHDEHDFTVFAGRLTLPSEGTSAVRHIAVPTVRRPALPSFLLYFVGACLSYVWVRVAGARFDLIHVTDASFPTGDVCYAHFCHRGYLSEVWPQIRTRLTPRVINNWASHAVRALIERRLLRRARVIVVPSEGLGRDFARIYPGVADKVTVIPNTVDIAHFRHPDDFDRDDIRRGLRAGPAHTVFVFVALGHFERKGLPTLLEALATDDPAFKDVCLWVVGGEPGLVASYRSRAERLGVAHNVRFVGRTDDVRPFLWSADAFVLPSHYEAFSAALLEAAAADLPLIATRISGSEEVLEDGVNGFEMELTPMGVAAALGRFLALSSDRREAMRSAARQSVEPLGPDRFATEWRALYASLAG
jgi:glycosyltransferase involved in cell wall biosynthesis